MNRRHASILLLLLSLALAAVAVSGDPDARLDEGETVNYTGMVYQDGYFFMFQESIASDQPNITVYGRSYPGSSVKVIRLRTGRMADDVVDTCRHEILHYYFPDYRHPDFSEPGVSRSNDPIYRLQDDVDFGVCRGVVGTALKRQGL